MGRQRLFEPTSVWSMPDGRPSERANGWLRSISDYIGAGVGTVPAGSLGLDGDASHFLDGTGVPRTPDYPVGANPTAQTGITAVSGAAASFMRSDASPALNLGITPTWTGQHTFNAGIISTSGVFSTTMTVGTGFGCNGKSAQTSAALNAAISSTAGAAYTATEQTMLNDTKALLNQIRAALIANGIGS
jgi:hypothetical protein